VWAVLAVKRDWSQRRPRLALPFTILCATDIVRLVAGEDFRYTLTGPGLERWLGDILRRLDGTRTIDEIAGAGDQDHRDDLLQILQRLYGERILADGPAEAAHRAKTYRLVPDGTGGIRSRLEQLAAAQDVSGEALTVFCQDRLDYDAALRFQQACRREGRPYLWASYGAMSRGYVSPLFLPDAGPCLGCLLRSFERLSPAPEIYRDLRQHAGNGHEITPVPFPESGVTMLAELVRWKARLAEEAQPPAALFRLHVLETATLEVTSHRVFVDPECPECLV
jgi:bacteriocin biosynthesis cyclodehydratase domain-containing protein